MRFNVHHLLWQQACRRARSGGSWDRIFLGIVHTPRTLRAIASEVEGIALEEAVKVVNA